MDRLRTNTYRDGFDANLCGVGPKPINFATNLIGFAAPPCGSRSFPCRFERERIGFQPPTVGLGSFLRFISGLRRFAWSWKVTVKTGFKKLSDSQALAIAGAVANGLFVDKAIAAAPPFDETTLQTAVDDLTGAIAAQAQAGGCTAVTAVKNKKRSVLDGLLRRLAQYVQAN